MLIVLTDEVGLPKSPRAENLGTDLRDHSLSQNNNLHLLHDIGFYSLCKEAVVS